MIPSFTDLRDDLNCWRHYGDDGSGVCFGIRVSDLVKTYRKGDEFGIDLRAVRYDEIAHLSLVHSYLQEMIAVTNPDDPFLETFLEESLMHLAPIFKPSIYRGEGEWRFVVGNFIAERVSPQRRPLNFRVRDNNICPYVEIDISPNANLQPFHPVDRLKSDSLPISEVIVGSKVSRRNQVALKMALEACGHTTSIAVPSSLMIG